MTKPLSKSKELASRVVYAALQALKDHGGELEARRVIEEVEKRVTFHAWDKEVYEKSGFIRWNSMLHLFSIDCAKAGFLIKKGGVWYLTQEGEESLKKYDAPALISHVTQEYKKWKKDNAINDNTKEDTLEETTEITLEKVQETALEGLKEYIRKKNPYEFQDLVAALLRGMGYYTPFVAPKGKDGGVDIIAYKDPLGTSTPRIKVQCKHRESSVSVQEIRELMGLLQKDGDVGIFISTGGFSPDAKTTSRTSSVHIELIDFNRLINLWQEFYPKLSDTDKQALPLTAVYLLSPDEN